jgi:tetratricopeptide (TPR) repeat protein
VTGNGVSNAWIYLRGVASAPSTGADPGVHPSLLLFTRPGPPGLEKASRLPASLTDKSDATLGFVPAICLADNPFGPHEFFQAYFSGWIRRAKPGRVYFCTVSREESELRVDGKTAAAWPADTNRDKGAKGQFGSWAELAAGLHHIEYVTYARDRGREMQAAWKIPGETQGDLPVAIPKAAYLQSGRCRLVRGDFRDGRPVVAVTGHQTPSRYVWFGDRPLNLYELGATLYSGTSNDTACTWTFTPDQAVTWPVISWLYAGGTTNTVTLTASNRQGATRVAAPIEVVGETPRANINNSLDRAWFRAVLLGMCRAVPAGKSPCARWTPDFWETLVNLCPPFEGTELLGVIFDRGRRETLALDRSKRWALEDVFIGGRRTENPEDALRWIDRFEKDETDPERRLAWKQERFDLLLYDFNDTVAARRLAGDLRAAAQTPEQSLRALIRLGDVEHAVTNLEAAVAFYGDAQDRFHEQVRRGLALPRTMPTAAPDREPRRPRRRMLALRTSAHVPNRDWKAMAVREASFYSTVDSLTRGGYFIEARDALRQWELEAPLSKLSGDYPLAEAGYYVAAGNVRRALAGLTLYRQSMDLSSSLPEVMDLELRCLVQLKRQKEAEALAGEILKQFPNHPAAERAKQVLVKR